jgi:drug/metabolite transporter (DMT)-like permease
VLALALGLCAGLTWGLADFLGGLKSRKLALVTVLIVSQAMGLALIAAIVGARGVGPPAGEYSVYAALSGVAGLFGLAAFYRGLAVGAMSVVAPISATAAIIPVTVGVVAGDRPSALQGLGVAFALIGVALASREAAEELEEGGGRIAAGVGLALISALGFGSFFVAMDVASDGDVFWAILVNRITGVSVLVLLTLALRPSLAVGGADAGALLSIGVLDISANALFAVAATEGLVSLVAVLASLYPIVTIVLARFLLRERIHRSQQAGVAGALAGVALITVG